ncbi:MAG: hypothetical protein Q7S31_03310 [bacterium]|nr:hypothetical protein [bacterium]
MTAHQERIWGQAERVAEEHARVQSAKCYKQLINLQRKGEKADFKLAKQVVNRWNSWVEYISFGDPQEIYAHEATLGKTRRGPVILLGEEITPDEDDY